MVGYVCDICGNKYASFEEAHKCESQSLVGPEIRPGLLLSHKDVDEGFLVFLKELSPNRHFRRYFFEELYDFGGGKYLSVIQTIIGPWGKFKKFAEPYRLPTEEEIKKISEMNHEGKINFSRLESSAVFHGEAPEDLWSITI